MGTALILVERLRRRGRVVAAALLTGSLVAVAGSAALGAPAASPPPGDLTDYELGGTAGVVDFKFSYPNLVLPYVITGGVLDSFSLAAGTGRAQGVAGPMPVPIATSGALLVPTNDPITGTPIPEEIRKALQSIDFTAFPNQCQSDYPPVAKGGDNRYCGGPASEDQRLGFTAAFANGHTVSSGDSDDPLKSAAESTSRGSSVNIPALQTTIRNGWSKATAKVNDNGLPESRSEVDIDALAFLTGLVQIEGVHSVATAGSDGTEQGASGSTAFNVREVRIAGIPVIVGRDGVVVNDQQLVPGTSVRQAADAVTEAMAKNELQMRLVPAPPPQKQGPQVSVQSGGIEIVHRGSTVTPADSVYRIGFTAARASATRSAASDDILGVDGPAADATGSAGSDISSSDSGAAGSSGDLGATGSSSGSSFDDFAGSSAGADGSSASGAPFGGASGAFAPPDVFSAGSADGAGAAGGSAPVVDGSTTSEVAQPAATAVAFSPLPAASVRYVFAVFVGLMLLGALAVPLRH